MAATGVSSVKSEKSSQTFSKSLSSAFFEWMLMFLLFVNALFSYLATKFARYCGLQIPCLLCSRLDHILGKERLGFYWDMICSHHKSEISSLVLCHAHRKLVDVHGICENCLFSFATINKSNAETYRLLVGKLGADSDSGSSEEESPPEDRRIRKSSVELCSCCNKPWISRGPTQTLIQTTSIMSQLAELNVPLSGVIGALKNIGDGSSKRIGRGISDLSHVGYTELKITSDTESEVPLSDDDEINGLVSKREGLREISLVDPSQVDPVINVPSCDSVVKLEEQVSAEESSASVLETKVDATEAQTDEAVGLAVEHGLDEINWQNSEIKDRDASASIAELISFDDFPSESSSGATFGKLSPENTVPENNEALKKDWEENLDVETEPITTTEKPVEANLGSSVLSPRVRDLLDLGDAYEPGVTETNEALEKNSEKNMEVEIEPITTTVKPVEADLVSSDSSPQVRNLLDLGDAYKPVVTETNEAPVKDSEENLEVETEPITTEKPVEEDLVSSDSSPRVPNLLDLGDAYKLGVTETNEALVKDSEVETEPITTTEKLVEADLVSSDPSPHVPNLLDLSDAYKFAATETNEAPGKDSEENLKVETEPPMTPTEKPAEANLISSDSSPRVPNLLDLGDAYKLAVGNRGRQLSGVLTEQWLAKDSSSRVSEDLKNLFSQLSAPRVFDQSSAPDLSPKFPLNDEDSLKALDALHKRISLERNESGLSQDGSLVSEIEGESSVDRLKRQVEHDRRALGALYKELEEERNASAIAANQAMAMITRLQEEKATLQMEALQYLRMMEEQAEYDMEALQKSNDLLAEREKDIQDLEEELEFYRIQLGGENQIPENFGIHPKVESIDVGRMKDSTIGIEDERLHILESLKKLEEKIGLSSGEEVISESENCESRCSGKEEASVCDSTQNDVTLSTDAGSGSRETSPDNHTNKDDCAGKSSRASEGVDLASVKNEVLYLQKRLEALEADRNFLERTVKHLRIGEEGLQLVRDIASRLQEIRRTKTTADHQPSP